VAKLRTEIVKPIGGGTDACFHLGMTNLSARVIIRVQLTCGNGMAATVLGGVTSSVPMWTRTLWYSGNFFVFCSNCNTPCYENPNQSH
jgi:hypothetical protein